MSLRLLIAIACAGCAASHKEADEPRPVTDVSPLEQKLAQNPDDPKVNLELGDRAALGGDWLRAEQYYQRAEALGVPEEAVVPRVLRVLVMARRYDEALARCHRRLLQKPEDRGTRLVEAAILQALERPHEAEHDLGLLVKTQPKDPNPYLALGKLYRDTYHDATRARAMFEKYLALAPKGDEAEALRYQIEEEPPPVPDPPAPVAPSPTPAAPSVAPAAPAKPAGRPSRSAAPPATPAPLFTAPSTPEATP